MSSGVPAIPQTNPGTGAIESGGPKEALLATPRFLRTATLLLCLSIFLKTLLRGDDLMAFSAALMPLQLYWAFCLYRMSQVTGKKFGTEAPLSEMTILLLTAISMFCLPRLDAFPMGAYIWDPFAWIWLCSQMVGPWVLSMALERGQAKRLGVAPKSYTYTAVWLTALSCAFVPFFAAVPSPAFITMLFIPAWTLCQFGTMSVYNRCLRAQFSNDLKLIKTIKAKVSALKLLSKEYPLVVNYQAYAGVERWLRERFAVQTENKSAKIIFASVLAPFLLVLAIGGVALFNGAAGTTAAQPSLATAGATLAVAGAGTTTYNLFFVTALPLLFGSLWLLATARYLAQPTQLALGPKGLKLLWRHRAARKLDKEIPWSQLASIGYENPSDNRLFASKKILLNDTAGGVVKLTLSSIEKPEDKEALLAGIEKWGKDVPRDPEVEQLLLPSANHTYTELWLQALSAPPKRERLKPLADQSLLHDARYQVLGALGVGGQGSAYTALDRVDNCSVVLKEFILPVFVNVKVRKSALEQFENEAKILRQLNNDQIVKLLDFFVEDHRAYLVLEHIEGTSLRTLVDKQGPLKEDRVRSLAVQMCRILEYLHGLRPPVVHRDFTPDNLILRNDGKLKLIDFNVAQQVEETTTGTVVGKHAYLPPEQFRGEPTTQSDLYALGATLYYLLTGEDPEPISSSHPRAKVPEVSQDLDEIIARATNISEEDRYKSAAEIERVLAGDGQH